MVVPFSSLFLTTMLYYLQTTTALLPLSTRAALLEKSKWINGGKSNNKLPATWSNRAGTILTPVAQGVYSADRPFLWNTIDVGCRSVILELPNGLFVHSPVNIDGAMMETVAKLGHVQYIVTPNYEHTKFASLWHQNFKDAEMWGCPGISERIDLPWKEIPLGYRPGDPLDNGWDTSILQALHMNVEKNPFTGRPFFNEVVFYHKPSKTLITTDLFWNYPTKVPNQEFGRDDTWELAPQQTVPITTKLWKFGMDQVYYPFYNQWMVTDKDEYERIARQILAWDIEVVVPAHGDILRGKELIQTCLSKFFGLNE